MVHCVTVGTALLVNLFVLLPGLSRILGWLHLAGYNFCILSMLLAHLRCMCTNPGTAKDHLDQELVEVMRWKYEKIRPTFPGNPAADGPTAQVWWPPGQRKWWCPKCETYRPRHTHHCSTCRCCILEMDHHCPWVNNCVGWRNHKYFLVFIMYAWLSCLWSATIFLYALFAMDSRDAGLMLARRPPVLSEGLLAGLWQLRRRFGDLHESLAAQFACILSCVICVLMFVFVSVSGCDQREFLAQGYGIVSKKQLEKTPCVSDAHRVADEDDGPPPKLTWEKLEHAMGHPGPLRWRWFFPLSPGEMSTALVPKDKTIADAIEGYREDLSAQAPSSTGTDVAGPDLGQATTGAGERVDGTNAASLRRRGQSSAGTPECATRPHGVQPWAAKILQAEDSEPGSSSDEGCPW